MRDTGSVSGPSRWRAPVAQGPVDATVPVPASKSLMARHMVLACLAEQPTTVHNPLVARDSMLMAAALSALGASVAAAQAGPWTLRPLERPAGGDVDCGLSGTVMRFVPPLAALADATVCFDGDRRARERPMGGLLVPAAALMIGWVLAGAEHRWHRVMGVAAAAVWLLATGWTVLAGHSGAVSVWGGL